MKRTIVFLPLLVMVAPCQQVPDPVGRRVLGLDAAISLPERWARGSPVAARLEVQEAPDIQNLTAAGGAEVRVDFLDGARERELWRGRADGRGLAIARFDAPEVRAGRYQARVTVAKGGVERELTREVEVVDDLRVMLTTDKPLYQPGQTIHVRALALRAMDLEPARGERLTVEVEDGRGNRVFRRNLQTSRHGITSTDFTLADEVNLGEYRIVARRGDETASERTVAVQRYVLPKFKVEVDGLEPFYRPGTTVRGTVQAEYFFGKKVRRGGVCIIGKTFDTEMHEFARASGWTDGSGAFSFEIELPEAFAGTPLDRGDARVFLEVAVRDRAEHTERKTVSFPVTTSPLRVELVPESGRIVPGVENEVFAVAARADGRPAPGVEVEATFPGAGARQARTDDSGIVSFRWVPSQPPRQFWDQPEGHPCQRSAGYQVRVQARDSSGQAFDATRCIGAERGAAASVLVRTDRALYRGGETMRVSVLGPGTGDAFVDVVKLGQTVLTSVLERAADGGLRLDLPIPPDLFGTLEVHAYRLQADGTWARDGRVVQVEPPDGLRIHVEADRQTHRPGQDARIRFRVTDADGTPTPAALGVILVDESVYALQDNRPGLERVYFMLEEEILRPRYSIYGPAGLTFAAVVEGDDRQRIQQEAARVLLANASVPDRPVRLWRDPRAERARFIDQTVPKLLGAVVTHLADHPDDAVPGPSGWRFADDLPPRWVADGLVTREELVDPLGAPITLESLRSIDPELGFEKVALEAAHARLFELIQIVLGSGRAPTRDLLDQLVAAGRIAPQKLVDPWGGRFVWRSGGRFRHPDAPRGFEIASPGPDGRMGTRDAVSDPWRRVFRGHGRLQAVFDASPRLRDKAWRDEERRERAMAWRYSRRMRRPMARVASGIGMGSTSDARAGGASGAAAPPPRSPRPVQAAERTRSNAPPQPAATTRREGERAVVRVREYFPETLLFRPEVVTNERGEAEVSLQMADSITTWRLTASANSASGLLGSTTAGMRVFQDFFVDLDLPVALTQNDQVSVPVAVYNYLSRPQHVRLALERADWFDLVGPEEQSLDLAPGEVTVRYFPIRARRIGSRRLGVFAYGDRMSDAIRKAVQIEPDGKVEEVAHSDRLGREAEREVSIPEEAIPGSEKLFVKLYPGVVSQVVENMDALLRVPYG